MKILIAGGGTGGHLMPALNLARAAADLGHDIVLAGAHRGIEARLLPKQQFRFHLLPFEPIYRRQWWKNILWPIIAVRVSLKVNKMLARERPAIVIGTGGYAAGPIVWRAQQLGIPTVLQEQNAFPGLTTRMLSRRARQVHLGFPEARELLTPGPTTEIFALGNPIAPPVPMDAATARAELGSDARRRTVFVVGGSQGARGINAAVARALQSGLLGDVNVLWGTGAAHEATYQPLAVPGRVVVRGFFDPIAPAYAAADLVVARAGAMTVAELCAWGKPSVLVPLPTAAADHQTYNARAMADAGASIHLPESDLTPDALARTVSGLVGDPGRLEGMAQLAQKRGQPTASRDIVAKVLGVSQV